MGLIKLRNVSKYYYSKGIIASGLSNINLDIDAGEFVVITGESGSGKSTLLNVVAGLDSYEDGEMYIDGCETSHYTAVDFEEYRQKYVSCIFQSFNLVSSYTVYQNVALAMQIDGYEDKEIRRKVLEILDKVGLSAFKNRKVSKLSGGQKQRVAIARALAKDTRILVADEPTGNLDSESAEGIVQLLTEISEDKLVIVVTHNYDQFKKHATRVIKMHDGKIVEDTGIRGNISTVSLPVQRNRSTRVQGHYNKKKSIAFGTQMRLGIRNTFNLPTKLILLFLVFIFVISAVSAQYVTVKKQKDTISEQGSNDYFSNYNPKRIVLVKTDKSAFTRSDYEALENAPHVEKLIKEDMLYDSSMFIENDDFSFFGYVLSISNFDGELSYGTLPEKDNEVLLSGSDDDGSFGDDPESLIGKSYSITTDDGVERKLKVTGIALKQTSSDTGLEDTIDNNEIYFTQGMIDEMRKGLFASNGTTTLLINGKEQRISVGQGGLMANENVPEGYILLPTSYDSNFKEGYAAGKETKLKVKALYYEYFLDLVVMGTYGEKTFEKKTGLKNLSDHDGEIYINPTDYRRMYEKGSYQASVFVDDTKNMEGMTDMLERGGYHTLVLKDHIYNYMDVDLTSVLQLPFAVIVCIAVFFIAYFVIRLILKSRV